MFSRFFNKGCGSFGKRSPVFQSTRYSAYKTKAKGVAFSIFNGINKTHRGAGFLFGTVLFTVVATSTVENIEVLERLEPIRSRVREYIKNAPDSFYSSCLDDSDLKPKIPEMEDLPSETIYPEKPNDYFTPHIPKPRIPEEEEKYEEIDLGNEYKKHLYTPEAQQALKDVYELGLGSGHPWFPLDRVDSELYWNNWTPHTRNLFPAIIPPRVPVPYGKPLSLIMDTKILLNKHGKRPGTDLFLLAISEFYELLLFASNGDDFDEIDEHGQLLTYQLCPDLTDDYPQFGIFWKNLYALNRPEDSSVIIEATAEEAFLFPNNTLVVPVWEGNQDDMILQGLNELLFSIAYESVVKKKRVDHIVPTYHSIFMDAVNDYLSKMPRSTVTVETEEAYNRLQYELRSVIRDIKEGTSEFYSPPKMVELPEITDDFFKIS